MPACFDSDQTEPVKAPEVTDTGGGGIYTTAGPMTGTTSAPSTETGDRTCRDGLACIVNCILTHEDPTPGPEEALECILVCQEGMTSDEVLKLLRLTECVGDQCKLEGACETVDTGTGTGTTSGSGTGTTTGGGGNTGLDECTQCLFAGLLDPEPPGCLEQAANCT